MSSSVVQDISAKTGLSPSCLTNSLVVKFFREMAWRRDTIGLENSESSNRRSRRIRLSTDSSETRT